MERGAEATYSTALQSPTFQPAAARPQREEPELQASDRHLAAEAQLSHASQAGVGGRRDGGEVTRTVLATEISWGWP